MTIDTATLRHEVERKLDSAAISSQHDADLLIIEALRLVARHVFAEPQAGGEKVVTHWHGPGKFGAACGVDDMSAYISQIAEDVTCPACLKLLHPEPAAAKQEVPKLRCPKCGCENISVARNMRSTGHCANCGYEEDDAYKTFKKDEVMAETSAPRTRGEKAITALVLKENRDIDDPLSCEIPADRAAEIIDTEVAAAVAEERERCAKVAGNEGGSLNTPGWNLACEQIASRIRAAATRTEGAR